MTAPAYVVGIPVVAAGHGPYHPGLALNRVVTVAHAVPMPVTDNPAQSLCGLLVIAAADLRWHEVWGAPRCTACVRVTG